VSSAPEASVIIPAHNEANVLGRCLSALLDGPMRLEVVVVANGCSDATADVARSHGVVVIETAMRGKVPALNLGDESAASFPRVYLDADVTLHQSDVRTLIDFMNSRGLPAAAPRLVYDRHNLSRWVRWYYDVWTATPYVTDDLIGSGVYAVSEEGRRRWRRFPDVVADDGFVRALFSAGDERRTAKQACFTIYPPQNVWALVRVKSRVWAGNDQLRRLGLATSSRQVESGGAGGHPGVRVTPSLMHKRAVYVFVDTYARLLGRSRVARGTGLAWTRDETSRRAKSSQ